MDKAVQAQSIFEDQGVNALVRWMRENAVVSTQVSRHCDCCDDMHDLQVTVLEDGAIVYDRITEDFYAIRDEPSCGGEHYDFMPGEFCPECLYEAPCDEEVNEDDNRE